MTAQTLRATARFDSSARRLSPALRRAGLVAACLLAMAATAITIEPSDLVRSDPDLARLLRGMALIKALILAATIALASWRLGFALRPGVAASYVAGTVAMAVATVLIWQLASLPFAAVLFHVGLFVVAVIAWRVDRDGIALHGRRTPA